MSYPYPDGESILHDRSRGGRLLLASLLVMAGLDVVSTAEVIAGATLVGHVLWVSPSAFSTLFIAVSILLRRRGVQPAEVFLVSLLTVVSYIWLYELSYFLGFWVDFAALFKVFPNLGNVSLGTQTTAAAYQVVASDLLYISPGLVGLKYMRVNVPFVLFFSVYIVAFLAWVFIGYPQTTFPGELFPFNGVILIRVSNPAWWAPVLNDATKYLLAGSYASVFMTKGMSFERPVR